MAPPTKLRPHLNDLLQKNLELEHVVADLRHQLTQSAAKWNDERKLLAVGCDTLMASFAKFRARLDVHPSDWGDSEAEVEQNLDVGMQNEEVDAAMLEAEGDQGSTMEHSLRERCHALAAELQVKEEELEESRRERETAEVELHRVQRSLEAQREQLRAVLAPAKTGTKNKTSSERPSDDTAQAGPSETDLKNALKKLDIANQEISRLKQLLQQWQKYGNDWKREAQVVQARASGLELRELELIAQIKVAEGRTVLPDGERQEVQQLIDALAEKTAALEQQRTACQESVKRVDDLEAMVALLRARLSPEQLASFDSEQNRSTPPNPTQNSMQNPTTSPTATAIPSQPEGSCLTCPQPQPDTDTSKRSELIMLKIPYRPLKKSSAEDTGSQDEQRNVSPPSQAPVSQPARVSPAPQTSNNPTEFELCIHTCNPLPCRNEAQSFLWARRQTSLPRHVLSAKKHRHCTPDCPGHWLLAMPLGDAMKQPRRLKVRPPTMEELSLAEGEARKLTHRERSDEQETAPEGENEREGSGEPEAPEEHEEGSTRVEEGQEGGEEGSPQKKEAPRVRKRLRSRVSDVEHHPTNPPKRAFRGFAYSNRRPPR